MIVPGLVACGSDQPPVCDSLSAVQHSVNELKQDNLSTNGLTAMTDNLKQVEVDLRKLASDAHSQFTAEAQQVKVALEQLSAVVKTAEADLSPANLQAVKSALTAVGDAARNLGTAVSSTC